ncbi:amidohydrolase [Mesorhizobium xinjiangense]|uniref:amidohydrolase n=1 Tax=Mesorhizobium xinjiangense TaxID=2678685 RepID=UPI0018DE78E4|nr:amidohydrolase [Mesorhizobium xinjiangense]
MTVHTFLRKMALLSFVSAVGIGSAHAQDGASDQAADMILRNGNILTVDGEFSAASAVAIDDGKFVAVGSDEEIATYKDDDTRVIDLQGKTAIPGLLDNHLHQNRAALNAPLVSLLEARSIADVVDAIGSRVEQAEPGEWVQASSAWHESTLEEGRLPTRTELDEVSPDNPVFIPRGGHVVTVNSAALELAGITAETEDPEGGVIVRDENGEPTGVLLEHATELVEDVLPPPPSIAEQTELLKDFMAQLNAYGVVGVVEPGLNDDQIATYRQLHEAGEMSVRTHMLYRIQGMEGAQHFVDTYDRSGNDGMLSIDGVKYLLDGGVEGARLYKPYQVVEGEQPDPNYRGVLLLPKGGEEELVNALSMVAKDNWQAQIHAVGDETIDTALNAIEKVDQEIPVEDHRWAIMHIFLPTDEAMQRMKDMDILATVQDHAFLLGHNQLRYWGDERAGYAIPIRSLLDAGVETSGGTDAPVLPANPFYSISWMVTRELLNGDVLGPEQAISREEALKLWTIRSAYLMGVEDEQGSIEPGKRADIAVLSDDIMSVPDDKIADISAVATILDGEIVYGEDRL